MPDSRTNQISISKERIVHSTIKSGARIQLKDQKQNLQIIQELAGDKLPFVAIADIRKVVSVSSEARKFMISNFPPNLKRVAMVTDSPVSRLIGNVFLGLSRPPTPVKLFSTLEEATEWVRNDPELQKVNSRTNLHN